MKLYLAGPMSGYPDQNAAEFDRVAQILRDMGHEVFSPAEQDRKLGYVPGRPETRPETLALLNFADVMRQDLQEVLAADGAVFLDGWFKSNGAVLERIVAESTGRVCYRLQFVDRDFGLALVEMPPFRHDAVYRMGQEAGYARRA